MWLFVMTEYYLKCLFGYTRNWGGSGSLGCDIGYGYLHRIPAPRSDSDASGLSCNLLNSLSLLFSLQHLCFKTLQTRNRMFNKRSTCRKLNRPILLRWWTFQNLTVNHLWEQFQILCRPQARNLIFQVTLFCNHISLQH